MNYITKEIELLARIIHAFALQKFGHEEFQVGALNRAFSEELHVGLSEFLGGEKFKIYRKEVWFKALFRSRAGGFYSAIGEASVDLSDSEVLRQIDRQRDAVLKSRGDVATGATSRHSLGLLKLDPGKHFFGIFDNNARHQDSKAIGPAIKSVYVENIEGVYANYALLGDRFRDAGYTKNMFAVGVCDGAGIPMPLDRSMRAVVIRKWTDFHESSDGSFEKFMSSRGDKLLHPKWAQMLVRGTEILLLDAEALYAGFDIDKTEKKQCALRATKIFVAHGAFDRDETLMSVIRPYGALQWVDYGREKLLVGEPSRERWATTDDFFGDQQFWQELKVNMVSAEDRAVMSSQVLGGPSIKESRRDAIDLGAVSGMGSADGKSADGSYQRCTETELTFLKKLMTVAGDAGFLYDSQDIIRFHTSVKTGMFTLLGGAPGSGKSSLAALYARALLGESVLTPSSGFLAVDVSPAWTEPDDLLGYWNLQNEYVPSASGLVPFLRKAVTREKMSIVCFEEMNLARVEHYFASFIQAFSRSSAERVLPGVPAADNRDRECNLVVPNAIRFVGTNNFDETTQHISARFYDRCNYIELNEITQDSPLDIKVPSMESARFDFSVARDEYLSWFSHDGLFPVSEKAKEKFNDLMPRLRDAGLAPSSRVRVAIYQYIVNRPFGNLLGGSVATKDEADMVALDEAIAQRILPKYRPNLGADESSKCKKLETCLEGLALSLKLFQGIQKRMELLVR